MVYDEGKWTQQLKQRPRRNIAHLLAPQGFLTLLYYTPRTTYLGVVPPGVVWDLPY